MAYILKNSTGQIAHAINREAPAGTPAIKITFKRYQDAFNFRADKNLVGWQIEEE